MEAGAKHIVALPLFLGAGGHQKNDVPTTINWTRTQWPEVSIQYGVPLGAHYQLANALADRAEAAIEASSSDIEAQETALLIIGRGSRDPDSNSDVYKISRMLWEGRDYARVESAFFSLTTPNITDGVKACIQLGARRVVLLPYLLFTGRIRDRIDEIGQDLQRTYPQTDIVVADHLGAHPAVIAAVAQRYEEVVQDIATMTCDACKYRQPMAGFENEFGLPQFSDHQHGLRGVGHDHGYERAMQDLLPPRYQNGSDVSAAPMGTAPMAYDNNGDVAWDEMWTDFCDLALAGGPAHRNDLLEPVQPDDVQNDLTAYETVLNELERGISLVTNLPVVRSRSPGWIGLVCNTEDMALWLLRAIVVENIAVRREGAILFLPAGPNFRMDKEIKNVITVVAKTHHYWTEHMATQQAVPTPEK
ncbi:MAG: sirohydrochlorin chelatase [Chloroflexota bacterium]